MSLRDNRQKEFADKYMQSNGRGILHLCPRFGKCRVGILVFKELGNDPTILIAYPDVKIKASWQNEFEKTSYENPNITFTTHRSLHKYNKNKYDIVILDEIHLLSDKQIFDVHSLLDNNKRVLGLTGTMNSWTERTLTKGLGLNVIGQYSIEKAIDEGVITDYRITVVKVPLDNKVRNVYSGKKRTELEHFKYLSSLIAKFEEKGRDPKFIRFARMRVIQSSISKLEATKDLLKKFENERILVFCGLTGTADNLGCPVYHNKKAEKQVFEDFRNGVGKHLAVVKIGNTGATYKPLNKVIINYFDSNSENLTQKINRCMAIEYDTPDKIADIHIVCSTEEAEDKWLQKALEFFDKSKIKTIYATGTLKHGFA